MPSKKPDEFKKAAAEAIEKEVIEGLQEESEDGEAEIQDNRREKVLREFFGLKKPEGAGRSGTDAVLKVRGQTVKFELKSLTRKGITTARDLGPKHIAKWRTMHWLIGFFNRSGTELQKCIYASPKLIRPWVDSRAKYIKLDLHLAKLPRKLDKKVFAEILNKNIGIKAKYTLADAKKVQKKQYSDLRYAELMDVDNGYSRGRMLTIIADRWQYLTERGSTLNNPHIKRSYYDKFVEISIASPRAARAALLKQVALALAEM